MPADTAARLARLLGLGSIKLFDSAAQLRDHDLLVRSEAADRLSRAATALRDLSSRYREERIPSATREQPFPPAERMAALKRLEERTRALQELAAKLRSETLPPQDLVWERLRSATLQYDLMLEADLGLVEPCETCAKAAEALGLSDADAPQGLDALDDTLRAVARALVARHSLLSPT